MDYASHPPARIADELLGLLAKGGHPSGSEAAKALAETHDPRAVEALIAALEPLDRRRPELYDFRLAVVEALRGLRDPRAIGPLMRVAFFNTGGNLAHAAWDAVQHIEGWSQSDAARAMIPDLVYKAGHPYVNGEDLWARKVLTLIDPALAATELPRIDKERGDNEELQNRAGAQIGFCQYCGKRSAPYHLRNGKFACDDACLLRYLAAAAFGGMTVLGGLDAPSVLQAENPFCWACGKTLTRRANACDACGKPQEVMWWDVDSWASPSTKKRWQFWK